VAPDAVSTAPDSGYLYLYESRFARTLRLVALAAIVGTAFIGHPHASLSGHGLVIFMSLMVAAATQVTLLVHPTGAWALGRLALSALSCGVVAGYEPTVGTAILLIFVGISAGAGLTLGSGGVITAVAVLTTALGVLASGQGTGNISLGAVAVVGYLAAAGRRQYALRAKEVELRLADAERAREEHARAAALAERANAAREIHDILAHSLGALVLQLDALGAVLEADAPDHRHAAEILARARALAVDGLSEARQAVGTLRSDRPPLIEGLRQLVDATENGSSLEIIGTAREISAQAAVAVRRTAQEGLTNAAKHAPGATPKVLLTFEPAEIVLTVTNPAGAPNNAPGSLAHTGGGYGIEGLKERAELLGGTLSAGPRGAAWQVTLRVPDGHIPPPSEDM
jgi:signal transduction histidine kinase